MYNIPLRPSFYREILETNPLNAVNYKRNQYNFNNFIDKHNI